MNWEDELFYEHRPILARAFCAFYSAALQDGFADLAGHVQAAEGKY